MAATVDPRHLTGAIPSALEPADRRRTLLLCAAGGLLALGLAWLAWKVLAPGPVVRLPQHPSPQACFDAMKAAAAAGDDERLAACLSPAGRDDECTGAIFRLVMSDAILKPTKGELPANVRAFMGRHGIDPALLRSCSNADKSKSVAQAIQETYLHRLADKPAFIADFWRLMDKYDAKREDPPKPASAAELKDVKIAGDQAEASVVMTIDAEEVAKSIKFRKIGRTWLVDEEDRIMSALRTRQADRAAPERAESPSLPE